MQFYKPPLTGYWEDILPIFCFREKIHTPPQFRGLVMVQTSSRVCVKVGGGGCYDVTGGGGGWQHPTPVLIQDQETEVLSARCSVATAPMEGPWLLMGAVYHHRYYTFPLRKSDLRRCPQVQQRVAVINPQGFIVSRVLGRGMRNDRGGSRVGYRAVRPWDTSCLVKGSKSPKFWGRVTVCTVSSKLCGRRPNVASCG